VKNSAIPLTGTGGVLTSLSMAVEPVGGQTTESMTHGQCDARPTVTVPATEHQRPLTGTKLYCLVNRCTCVWTTCPRLLPGTAPGGSQTCNLAITSPTCYRYTTKRHLYVIFIAVATEKVFRMLYPCGCLGIVINIEDSSVGSYGSRPAWRQRLLSFSNGGTTTWCRRDYWIFRFFLHRLEIQNWQWVTVKLTLHIIQIRNNCCLNPWKTCSLVTTVMFSVRNFHKLLTDWKNVSIIF